MGAVILVHIILRHESAQPQYAEDDNIYYRVHQKPEGSGYDGTYLG